MENNPDIESAMKLVQLGILLLGTALIGGIAGIAGMVRCYKNYRLSKTERWMWLGAQMTLMFPAFIYLIVIDKSPWWKAVGVISLIASLGMFLYIIMNPGLAQMPDLANLQGMGM